MISRRAKLALGRAWRQRFPNGREEHGCITERTYEVAQRVVSDLGKTMERSGSAVRVELWLVGELGEPGTCFLDILTGTRRVLVPFEIEPTYVKVAHQWVSLGHTKGAEFLMYVILGLIDKLTEMEREAESA